MRCDGLARDDYVFCMETHTAQCVRRWFGLGVMKWRSSRGMMRFDPVTCRILQQSGFLITF